MIFKPVWFSRELVLRDCTMSITVCFATRAGTHSSPCDGIVLSMTGMRSRT
jgi:hypothetical protein